MADEAALPEFLDPALDYLASILPPQVYSIATSILYYAYALLASAFHAAATIIKTPPAQWDAERLLPPIITLLASYLALLSFYRTTGWMIRTAFAFAKWGFILSALGAAAGYFLANANLDGNGGAGIGQYGAGLVGSLGAMILGVLNNESSKSTSSKRRTSKPKQPRPKPWESWDQHNQWQYSEHAQDEGQDSNVQEVIGKIVGSVGKAVRESGWWEAAKGVADDFKQAAQGEGRAGSSSTQKTQDKGKATKSR